MAWLLTTAWAWGLQQKCSLFPTSLWVATSLHPVISHWTGWTALVFLAIFLLPAKAADSSTVFILFPPTEHPAKVASFPEVAH